MFIRQRALYAPATDEGLAAAIAGGIEQAAPSSSSSSTSTTTEETSTDEVDQGAQGDPGAAATDTDDRGGDGAAAADTKTDDEQAAATGDDKTKGKPGASSADPKADRGDGRDASGRFVKKQGESDADFEKRKAAGGAPDAKGAKGKPAAAKPPDHVNDPIPDDVKGKTRERMTGLITAAKTLTTERDEWKKKSEDIWGAIADTGTNPDQFADIMDALTQINSDDVAERRKGIAFMRKFADDAGVALGDTPSGKDPLEGHQDLIDAVEDGDMKRELAIELATKRNREKAETKLTTERSQQTAEQREHAAAVKTAKADLNALGAKLLKANPALFRLKAQAVADAFVEVRDSIHPSKWAAKYEAIYNKLKIDVPPADTRERAPRGTGNSNPQRPGQPANGGGGREVKSLAEAVDFGIAQAARR